MIDRLTDAMEAELARQSELKVDQHFSVRPYLFGDDAARPAIIGIDGLVDIRALAGAMLRELMMPTPEMVQAGADVADWNDRLSDAEEQMAAEQVHRAMIGAALAVIDCPNQRG